MARIYRAEHEGLRRQVALKVLTDGVEPGTEGRARFLREARIAAAIKHPNVVNIFDIGVENKVPYLVMELLVGQDLETLLASHGALSEHTIIDIIIPVVAGLVAVHDAGVVHRDLKPGNIFLSRGPNEEIEPKLLDFGISRSIGAGENMRLTSTRGPLMGTPLYMSPEALLGSEMSALSDQYSLGVVLYECATGVNPFVAGSVAETARRVTTGQFTPLADQPIRPSRRLQAIIERAMSLDSARRFQDMRAFGQELLLLAGQRTRITWSLTFGTVAVAARANHTRDLDNPALALAKTRPPKRAGHFRAWPLLVAAGVGVATMVALFSWSAWREEQRATVDATAVSATRDITPGAPAPAGLARGALAPAARAPVHQGAAASNGTALQPGALLPHSVAAPPRLEPAHESVAARAGDRPAPGRPNPAPAENDGGEAVASAGGTRATTREPPTPARVAPSPSSDPPHSNGQPLNGEEGAAPATEASESPDWIVERNGRRRAPAPLPSERGTNNAFIFD
jgi:serine/threonine-protein kinase